MTRPLPPQPAEAPPDAVELARDLLHRIAEDAGLRPSHREAARRHLARLRAGAGRPLNADDFRDR